MMILADAFEFLINVGHDLFKCIYKKIHGNTAHATPKRVKK